MGRMSRGEVVKMKFVNATKCNLIEMNGIKNLYVYENEDGKKWPMLLTIFQSCEIYVSDSGWLEIVEVVIFCI